MVPRIILVILLALSFSVAASDDGSWFNDWWNNIYQQRIEKEQYQQLKKRENSRCKYKIEWYTKKVEENPNSIYYQYKLEDWKRRCSG